MKTQKEYRYCTRCNKRYIAFKSRVSTICYTCFRESNPGMFNRRFDKTQEQEALERIRKLTNP